MNKWLQGLNWWWIHLLASGISVSALSSKKVAMPQRSFWPWEGTDPCDRTHPPRWEQMTHRRLGRGFHWPSCNPVSCHNLQTWTVAQRYAVTCQSHISSVRVRLRPWLSDHHALLPSLRFQRPCQPLMFPNCCVSIRPRWMHLFQFNQKDLPSAGHTPFTVKEGSTEKTPSSGPAFFPPGPVHTILRKVSPLV